MRVHAYRPDSDLDVSLVAGARLALENLEADDVEVQIRISAIPGVRYALYGYFSEPSDLSTATLSIVAEEFGGASAADYVSPEIVRSLFGGASVDRPNRLIADAAAVFLHPVSQPLTIGQITSADYTTRWSEIPLVDGGHAQRWRQAFALQALDSYGMLREGANGLLVASEDLPIIAALRSRGMFLTFARTGFAPPSRKEDLATYDLAPAELESITGQFDFSIAITQPIWFADKGAFFSFLTAALRQVLPGGLFVMLFDYAAYSDQDERPTLETGFMPIRRDIEQFVMRIIGHGSDVAQLSFAEGVGNDRVIAAINPFGLIVRR
jgi:hypothetical protein